ncbi:MAG TPA: type I DNA topoisomerase [Oculatellaceae cyanobacterium]|jgi:DNA topoisomerase-1
MTKLLLIESPGKLKKLSQILGSGWIVKASMGHIRELADDGEDALGFDLDGEKVRCRYEARNERAKKVISELKQAVKQVNEVYIATDPDREGETIGWHLAQELRLKQPKRVTYAEITKPAVTTAISHPKILDQNLIAAGRARDCLDKLVGYKGSKHLVWALNNGAKSMGRVQSATLHLLAQRETEIIKFVPQDYWSVWVEYAEGFKAFYRRSLQGQTKEKTEEPDDASTETKTAESDRVTSQEEADRLVAIAKNNPHHIVKVENKTTSQSPPAAFITSTLQQAAGAKLRFSPEATMKVAQSLYEAGYITYMRTDSVALSDQFCADVREYLQQNDPENVPTKLAKHRAAKNAQEAHEAIRPTDVNLTPERLRSQVGSEQAQLYELIWNRAVASQCAAAKLAKTRIITQSESVYWEARGQVLVFPGYTKYWNNISDDSQLPKVKEGQLLTLKQARADKKQTQPPPRYTEPKLVQLMERKGIGRPSTYSPTIKTLKEREYVQLTKGKLQPTQLGMDLDAFLDQVLPDLIKAEFTAQMELKLDAIASGSLNWEYYLTSWNQEYFTPALSKAISEIKNFKQTRPQTNKSNAKSKASESINIQCPKCGQQMTKVASKSQKMKADHFLSCDKRNSGCGCVMFLNVKSGSYELPYSERKVAQETQSLTEFTCPVCSSFLERYEYSKNGQNKTMLRCSNSKNRQAKCKEVAFFESKTGNWWSPKFGEMKLIKAGKKTKRG